MKQFELWKVRGAVSWPRRAGGEGHGEVERRFVASDHVEARHLADQVICDGYGEGAYVSQLWELSRVTTDVLVDA